MILGKNILLKGLSAKTVLVPLLSIVFIFYSFSIIKIKENDNKVTEVSVVFPDSFIVGAINNGCTNNFANINALGLNSWHKFLMMEINKGKWIPAGWRDIDPVLLRNDSLYSNINSYKNAVGQIIERNRSHGLLSYLNRPKIEYLCFGQRSDYECEFIPDPPNAPENINWFYAFKDHEAGYDTADSFRKVRFCPANRQYTPGYAVKNLKINTEQTAISGQNMLFVDTNYTWYVKPVIKINMNDAYLNKQVCRIEIYSYYGACIRSVEISGANFLKNNFYNGDYKDEFNFSNPETNPLKIKGNEFNPGPVYDSGTDNFMDIRIYWYGVCDMWIDYVRVDNDIAHDLLSNDTNNANRKMYLDWIKWESQEIAVNPGSYKFYFDEPDYNMLPVINFVQKKIKQYNPSTSLVVSAYSAFFGPGGLILPQVLGNRNADSLGLTEVLCIYYPLRGRTYVPDVISGGSYNPALFRLGIPATRNIYENQLQALLDTSIDYVNFLKYSCDYAKQRNLPAVYIPQFMIVYDKSGYQLREPTTEEMDVLVNLLISYGAKGILYGVYDGYMVDDPLAYSAGLCQISDNILSRRDSNVYGQLKWKKAVEITKRLKKWGKHIIKFDIQNSNSYKYRVQNEREQLISESYVREIKTKTVNPNTACVYNIDNNTDFENPGNTFIQAATFRISAETYNKYLMIVNKRCAPAMNDNDECSGRRYIYLSLDSTNVGDFNVFKNWKVVDLFNDSAVATFDKNRSNVVNLGLFQPGEGKLYKIAPVMTDGGELAFDEYIGALSFLCEGVVKSNGHNITITGGSNIVFSPDGGIEMTGGKFLCGVNSRNMPVQNVGLYGKDGGYWKGLRFTGGDEIILKNTNLLVGQPQNPNAANYAVTLNNCSDYIITDNNLDIRSNQGAVYISNNAQISQWRNSLISGNTVSVNYYNEGAISVNCVSLVNMVIPVRITFNTFNCSYSQYSSIYLTGVNGGIIENNKFNNFPSALNSLNSSVYFYNNRVNSNLNNSTGVDCYNASLFISPVAGLPSGGYNIFNCMGAQSRNIYLNNSYIYIDNGHNIFNLPGSGSNFHIFGFLNSNNPDTTILARNNCFKIDNLPVSYERVDVRLGTPGGTPVVFEFEPRNCDSLSFAVYTGSSLNDEKEKPVFLSESNQKKSGDRQSCENLTDTIEANYIRGNYQPVINLCQFFLNNYSENKYSVEAVSKLYGSVLSVSQHDVSGLKLYLESLLRINMNNHGLVKKIFYLIQKCNVELKEYESALKGLRIIIDHNPYGYEGLYASWDYAAINLLLKHSKSSGGKNNKSDNQYVNPDTVNSLIGVYRENKTQQVEMFNQLQNLSVSGDINAMEELTRQKELSSAICYYYPETLEELNSIIQGSIKKVFKRAGNKIQNTQYTGKQTAFSVSPNYPNPFNSSTTIRYTLPGSGFITFKMYDLLGREVKTFINEYKSAGEYHLRININEIANTEISSGVYFYRISFRGETESQITGRMVIVK
ncbi:MAG: T9SS type A sorting domain-containing protein [Ignavibacteriae bacterium]|nr:T9SS type A sorting domain-containing protein [Ignavibacteriota bacterium]